MIRTLLFGLAATVLVSGAVAQGPDTDQPDDRELTRLDGFAKGLVEADTFAGVVLIARGDHILFEHAYGGRDANREGDPLTVDTRFDLASAGKMFTTVAVLQQIAAGRMTLDTRVGEVIRDYPNKAVAAVTVQQLLTHSGGTGGIDELFGAENEPRREGLRNVADMVALHADRAPLFPPGSKQEYDNFGAILLGRMVELRSGMAFQTYVEDRILRPTGMTRTTFTPCRERGTDVAVGYATVNGKRVVNCATQPHRGNPAGGELSTARDMYRFVRALQTGRLVLLPLFREATRTHREFAGLGFFATDYGTGFLPRDFRWGHGGSTDGGCADVRAYPATGEIMVVLSNRDAPACFGVARFLHAEWRSAATTTRGR